MSHIIPSGRCRSTPPGHLKPCTREGCQATTNVSTIAGRVEYDKEYARIVRYHKEHYKQGPSVLLYIQRVPCAKHRG